MEKDEKAGDISSFAKNFAFSLTIVAGGGNQLPGNGKCAKIKKKMTR